MALNRWPRWLRWLLTLPAALLAAGVIFFINSLAIQASAVLALAVGLPAMAIGSAAFVYGGRVMAPDFKRYAALTLAVVAISYAAYSAVVLWQTPQDVPQWYALLLPIASAAGAAYAVFAKLPAGRERNGGEVFAWMPKALRWVAFLPVAAVLSLAACFEIGVPLSWLQTNPDAIRLINTPIAIAVLIAVATAIAPSHKKVVVGALGALTTVGIVVLTIGAVNHAVTTEVNWSLPATEASRVGFYVDVGYQCISAVSALATAAICTLAVNAPPQS